MNNPVTPRPLEGIRVLEVGQLLAGPFAALERVIGTGWPLDSGQLLLFFLLAVWAARGLARREIRLRYAAVLLPLFLFIGAAALSLPGSLSPSLGLRELLKWGEMVLIVWLVLDLYWTADRRPPTAAPETYRGRPSAVGGQIGNQRQLSFIWSLLTALLTAALLQALVGIWQFGLRGHGPEHFAILGGFYRAYGTFEQPNPFGGYMALNAALALGVLYGLIAHVFRQPTANVGAGQAGRDPGHSPTSGARRRGDESVCHDEVAPAPSRPYDIVVRLRSFFLLPSSFFLLLTAVAASLAVLLSWSRGAWLGFGAALVTLLFFAPHKRWQGALLVGLALTGGLLAWQFNLIPGAISGRLASFQDDFRLGDVRGVPIHDANYAVVERLAHWQAAIGMAEASPWWGVGFGNYEPAYAEHALINWPYALGHAHNYYLNLLAEVGIIGLVAYLLLWTAVILQTIRALNRTDWPLRGVPLGLLAAWAALSVHHLVDKLYVNNIYIHLGVMFALLAITAAREDKGI